MWSTGLYPVTISVSDALLTTAELRQRTYQGIHDAFDQAVADGRASPFFLPLATLGPFLLPTIWLVIPHTHRPWLYNMRWFVAAAIVAVDLDLIRWARSPQSAIAYAVGVIAVWGILTTLNLLIWTRPQFDAARVIRRRKSLMVTGAGCDEKASIKNELRKMEDSKPMVQPGGTPGEDGGDEEYEYVWEPFPEDGPLLDRIYWAWGLLVSFRGVGKCITTQSSCPERAAGTCSVIVWLTRSQQAGTGGRRHYLTRRSLRRFGLGPRSTSRAYLQYPGAASHVPIQSASS